MTATQYASWSTVREELTRCLDSLDPSNFFVLRDELADQDGAWFVTGAGRSGLIGRMLAMRMMHLGLKVFVVGETTTPSIAQGDQLLAISTSGSTKSVLALSRQASELGARVVGITGARDSPLAELSDALVLIPKQESVQFGNTLFEHVLILLMDAVTHDIAFTVDPSMSALHARHANLE